MSNVIEDTVYVELRDLTFEVEVVYIPGNNSIDPRDYEEGQLNHYEVVEVLYDQGYAQFPQETVKWLAKEHADEIEEELKEMLL